VNRRRMKTLAAAKLNGGTTGLGLIVALFVPRIQKLFGRWPTLAKLQCRSACQGLDALRESTEYL